MIKVYFKNETLHTVSNLNTFFLICFGFSENILSRNAFFSILREDVDSKIITIKELTIIVLNILLNYLKNFFHSFLN